MLSVMGVCQTCSHSVFLIQLCTGSRRCHHFLLSHPFIFPDGVFYFLCRAEYELKGVSNLMNTGLPDHKDALDIEIDEKLARINEARKIPSTARDAAGCFARNFRPPKRAMEFSKLSKIDIPDFHSIEEIEQSFGCAIEAMLIAGYTDKEILKTAPTMDICNYNIFDIKRFIQEIKESERYAMLDALINNPHGYESAILDSLCIIVGGTYIAQVVMMLIEMWA